MMPSAYALGMASGAALVTRPTLLIATLARSAVVRAATTPVPNWLVALLRPLAALCLRRWRAAGLAQF
jgi:uncharacterized membrane protein YhaH (DUF805 family)